MLILSIIVIILASCSSKTDKSGSNDNNVPDTSSKEGNYDAVSQDSNCCSEALIGKGFKCLQNCGPPVAHPGDKITYSCFTPDDAASREKHGCPK